MKMHSAIRCFVTNPIADYAEPPIPSGYEYISGQWYGFVIVRKTDGSEFVWVPVGFLDPDGMMDLDSSEWEFVYNRKFGRRYDWCPEVDISEYEEKETETLQDQIRSVEKYGGYYLSRYMISQSETGTPQSVSEAEPLINVSYTEAYKIASKFEHRTIIRSHLLFAAEYDSFLAWTIKSGGQINYICNFMENIGIWTRETTIKQENVARKSNYTENIESKLQLTSQRINCQKGYKSKDIGFRIALYIK